MFAAGKPRLRWYWNFETRFHCVAQATVELQILPQFWDEHALSARLKSTVLYSLKLLAGRTFGWKGGRAWLSSLHFEWDCLFCSITGANPTMTYYIPFKFLLHFYLCAHKCVQSACHIVCVCGSQTTACGNQFSSATIQAGFGGKYLMGLVFHILLPQ